MLVLTYKAFTAASQLLKKLTIGLVSASTLSTQLWCRSVTWVWVNSVASKTIVSTFFVHSPYSGWSHFDCSGHSHLRLLWVLLALQRLPENEDAMQRHFGEDSKFDSENEASCLYSTFSSIRASICRIPSQGQRFLSHFLRAKSIWQSLHCHQLRLNIQILVSLILIVICNVRVLFDAAAAMRMLLAV